MLSEKDNEDLVRVGPGTTMGEYLRLFWMPFLPSSDLAADGKPKRVRLLGESLVAFRVTDGRIGLVDEACPHRRAPLAFGRNENCSLRCVYHGWQFNLDGECIDMPAESNKRAMKMVKLKTYVCKERNGIVWAYMGPNQATPPPLPDFEWNMVPDERVLVSFRVQKGNWFQALEGDLDSAHAPLLHGRADGAGIMGNLTAGKNLCPSFQVEKQDFGLSIGALRSIENSRTYVRVNQFVLPFYTLVGPQAKFPEITGHAWIPIDDEHVLSVMFSYHPSEPLDPRTIAIYKDGYKDRETGHASNAAMIKEDDSGRPFAGYWTRFSPENDFGFDYELQKSTWYSGLPGLWVQDYACQVGTDLIADRTREHLFTSDTGIVQARRVILERARHYEKEGEIPANAVDPGLTMVRPLSITLESGEDWKDTRNGPMQARIGEGFGYAP